MKKTVRDIEVKNKTVMMRCDFNVPLQDGKITDDTRIRAALPTIKYLVKEGAKVVIMSHLGRPKGIADKNLTLAPVAERLSELLGGNVEFCQSDIVVDETVKTKVSEMKPSDVVLLENVRFRSEETENNRDFSKELAALGDIFVQEAFGTSHRAHSSTAGIAEFMPAVSGFLIEKEIKFLGDAVESPVRPFVAIMGGAKVGDKIPAIENLLSKVDILIIGGGMAFTFLKVQGYEIGTSLVDEDSLEMAKEIIREAKEKDVKLILPVDVAAADKFSNEADYDIYDIGCIPSNRMGLDIGPKSIELFKEMLMGTKTVVWNGPMGVFEMSNYEAGTKAIAECLADLDAVTIVGGGDSAAAVHKFNMGNRMTHISTGGGASLKFLEGKDLPGISVLEDK